MSENATVTIVEPPPQGDAVVAQPGVELRGPFRGTCAPLSRLTKCGDTINFRGSTASVSVIVPATDDPLAQLICVYFDPSSLATFGGVSRYLGGSLLRGSSLSGNPIIWGESHHLGGLILTLRDPPRPGPAHPREHGDSAAPKSLDPKQ